MNYGELKTLIEGYLHRTDQTANLATFITLAQARVNRDLRVPEMESRATLTLASGDRFVTLPSDYRKMLNVQVAISGGRQLVLPMSLAQMDVEHSILGSGTPRNYSVLGDQLELQPAPGESLEIEIVYQYRLAAFSADADTNDILTDSPNIYVYAAMMEASPFVQADERMPMWHEMYKEERDRLNEEAEDRELSGGPLQILKMGVSTP